MAGLQLPRGKRMLLKSFRVLFVVQATVPMEGGADSGAGGLAGTEGSD
jgi:hypothetical protein